MTTPEKIIKHPSGAWMLTQDIQNLPASLIRHVLRVDPRRSNWTDPEFAEQFERFPFVSGKLNAARRRESLGIGLGVIGGMLLLPSGAGLIGDLLTGGGIGISGTVSLIAGAILATGIILVSRAVKKADREVWDEINYRRLRPEHKLVFLSMMYGCPNATTGKGEEEREFWLHANLLERREDLLRQDPRLETLEAQQAINDIDAKLDRYLQSTTGTIQPSQLAPEAPQVTDLPSARVLAEVTKAEIAARDEVERLR